ncbi:HNH endonuclease [Aquibacillus saliphilus]|uniref:HNH endonuclease n=1 Tax=Aquibacillus saliphilus TaxID=1909422 RepID=UPI001CF041AF|nr:HNH endonuclease [Aquibacillus saliphilus]
MILISVIYCRDGEKVIVDDSIYEKLRYYKWYVDRGSPATYTRIEGKYRRMYMKKLILFELGEFKDIDDLMKQKVYNADDDNFNCMRDNLSFIKSNQFYIDKGSYVIIYTRKNEEVLLDKDIWNQIKTKSVYLAGGVTPTMSSFNGKRGVSLIQLVLDVPNATNQIYYKNGNSCDLRKINLTKSMRTVVDKGEYIEVVFDNGDICLVDDDLLEFAKNNIFILSGNGYVYINVKGKRVGLHRVIMNAKDEEIVDHINWNPLDNRRVNLRLGTQSQNMLNRKSRQTNNSSGYRGVHKANGGKWATRVTIDGKTVRLGTFDNPNDANNVVANYRKENIPFSEMDK